MSLSAPHNDHITSPAKVMATAMVTVTNNGHGDQGSHEKDGHNNDGHDDDDQDGDDSLDASPALDASPVFWCLAAILSCPLQKGLPYLGARPRVFLEPNGENCSVALYFAQLCRGRIVCVVEQLGHRFRVRLLVAEGDLLPRFPLFRWPWSLLLSTVD